MKKSILAILFLLSHLAHAATWYATSSSANMSAISWVPTSTGSCTGSGTALVWGNQANGDVFDANGCTAIAVNVDPGSVSVQVTIQLNATNGGGFTYATAANITMHMNVGPSNYAGNVLTISGSTGGGTLSGSITGNSVASGAGVAVSDTHTSVTMNYTGTITGGTTYGSAHALVFSGTSGAISITGNCVGGAGGAFGCELTNSGTAGLTGNCVADLSGVGVGCGTTGGGAITVTGNLIWGLARSAATGKIRFTPAATNYILVPKDNSYTGAIDSHATEMPTNPGVGNVSSGVQYGSFTGTLISSGAVCATGGW